MKFIDVESLKRKDHYNYFKSLDSPHFNICANVDITNFYNYIKKNNLPFFVSVLYAATKAANSIKEFKLRIRGDKLIEHEFVNPSFTVMAKDEIFNFCEVDFLPEYKSFKSSALTEIEKVKNARTLNKDSNRDDLLYMTSIPWISFTSITHPISLSPADSIPRIAWGKYFNEGTTIKLPLSVQVHHALVDGVHVVHYFNNIQQILDNPENEL
ncbi:chloramphenicol acetyltransferase [Clostridium felsineum]|uniref:Chloramphenicol acetyltransferase n=1 Tax=Clostridium felsineum TaxID=36839 RepID=A0A1S8M958_9CLOT|nr:chloramphenicol acetyltransferase [Clostridium felsineum]URZ07384.1 Chloramphenicol acetyltransferase [Clostridium felsineum]URZ12415.1 Chloramphenicol acetyltransferase [Clostridium felsineum]